MQVIRGHCSPSLACHLLFADLNIMFLTQLTLQQSWVSRACIITLLLRCFALLRVGLLSFCVTAITTIRFGAAPNSPRPGRHRVRSLTAPFRASTPGTPTTPHSHRPALLHAGPPAPLSSRRLGARSPIATSFLFVGRSSSVVLLCPSAIIPSAFLRRHRCAPAVGGWWQ